MKKNINQKTDFVYVQASDGTPLMPTSRKGKVKWLLRLKQANVVSLNPFTIRLLYDSEKYVQEVSIGVDLGSKHVGISATTETTEFLACQVELRQDVAKKIAVKRQNRRSRRYRKTRYRKARFDNRKKGEGWLAPSIVQKIQSIESVLHIIDRILPVKTFHMEIGKFDIQKLENPDICGVEYQQGRQLGFLNTRAFIFSRDDYKCRKCKGKSGDQVLVIHHIESRQTGGDSPNNLVTLCKSCHDKLHRGEIDLEIDRIKSYRDPAQMNIMRKAVYQRFVSLFGKERVEATYGYITNFYRKQKGVVKTHMADALCISGNLNAKPLENCFVIRMIPRHSRSLHVVTPVRGGIRRSAVATHWIGKSRLQRFDFVKYGNINAFIAGSTGGRPVLRKIDWTLATSKPSVSAKSVSFLYRKKGSFIIQKIAKEIENKHSNHYN